MTPQLKVNALDDRKGEVLIYGEIGFSWWGDGTDAKSFTQKIDDLDVDTLTVRVHSPGGDAFDGITIMNALKRHPAKVTAHVDGWACSAASVIIMGADEIVMHEGTQIMIHDAWSGAYGNASDMEKQAAFLDKISEDMASIYARKAGTPQEEWREAMKEETWFTAEEAVAVGLADRIDAEEKELTDVSAFSDTRVYATFRYSGRKQAPAPALLANTPKGKPMTKEIVLDSPAMTKMQIDDLISTIKASTEDIKITVNGTPAQEANAANDASSAVEEAEAKLEEARTNTATETPNKDEGQDDDTVVVNKAVWEETLRRAAKGDEATAADTQDKAAALIEEHGIKAGRLLGFQRDSWVEKAVENYDATKASLMKLAPGIIPLAEQGRGGSDSHREALNNANPKAQEEKLAQKLDEQEILPTTSIW